MIDFADLVVGTPLVPLEIAVSAAANERYWRAAGIDHPRLRAGTLYPPIAANLSILAFNQTCPDAMIQTRQHLVCHRAAPAGSALLVTGAVIARYDKRGREYIDIETTIDMPAEADPTSSPRLWTSIITFTPTATLRAAQ